MVSNLQSGKSPSDLHAWRVHVQKRRDGASASTLAYSLALRGECATIKLLFRITEEKGGKGGCGLAYSNAMSIITTGGRGTTEQ